MSEFLDTNVILRYLLQDHPDHSPRCTTLFAQLTTGDIEFTTSHAVIAELVYVLSSHTLYGMSRLDIQQALTPVVSLTSFRIPDRTVVLRALDLYASMTIDFTDGLTVAQMELEQIATVVSFDRDFDKVSTITRREPT